MRRPAATQVTFRGHEIDLKAPWRRLKLVDALEGQGLWTRDEAELRSRLEERGVDTSQTRAGHSSSTTRSATSSSQS